MLDLPLENEIMTKVHELTGERVDIETQVYDLKGGTVQVNHYVCTMEDLFSEAPESDVYVQVNDVVLGFSVPPVTEDDRTLVPMRFLSENLGYTVTWNEETKTASIIEPSEFSADKTEHPELSGTTQKHYVVYQEGHREGRIELALFDIADGSAQSLVNREGALELSDNSKYQNDSKWYWKEGKWIPLEEGYERISNNAVSVISSDLPVAE